MAALSKRQLPPRGRMPRQLDANDDRLWQQVINAPAIFTFLDFDGTLVEIAPTPADVSLSEPRKRWLQELTLLPQCSVGVVSGRPIDELRRFIGVEQIFYVGCHGLEWAAPDGNRSMAWTQRTLLDALRSLREEMCRELARFAGVDLEDKGMSLALHYRRAQANEALAARKEFVRAVHWYQQQGIKIDLLPGKEVIEAKPAGSTKGDAVVQILARYAPAALPIYIGDDLTDESAFHAIGENGLAILVAASPRTSAAGWFVKNPRAVYAFLRRLIRARETKEGRSLQSAPD